MGFPDLEDILTTALVDGDLVAEDHIGTRTTINLQTSLPFVRVAAGGGPRDQVNAHTRVDVQIFAGTRATGRELAEDIDDYLTQNRIQGVDRITCASSPQEVPWPDPNVRTWIATYLAVTRRR